nr:unnamed protein product [Callosobruchus chinensis]
MDIEELDQEKLAELESMLYCQVFHSKETEDCQPTNPVPMEDNANVKPNAPRAKPRYFEKQSKRPPKKNSDRTWYSKSPEKTKQQQNNPDCTSPIQNNITINHYVYNVPGWSHRNDKEDSVEIVTSLKKKLSARKRPNRKERKEIKQKISEKVREQRKKNRSHVIFISDDEASNDCHTLPEDGGSIDLIDDSNSNSNGSSHDDEVLFVPTEPCEVIDLGSDDESAGNQETEQNAATDESSNRKNVDAGKENNNQEGKSDAGVQKLGNDNSKAITKVASNESQESNDFLDSGVVQDSQDCFDFQLHGSEFNQCSGRAGVASTSEQFVMPSKPSGEAHAAENHETESESASSTTTGTDRACSNDFSLKNIVFQEVDFPKADIFADNDLHGFEKLITPQRDDQAGAKPGKRGSNAKSAKKRTARTKQGEDPEEEDSSEDSEESSSESEYEEARTPRTSKANTPKAVHTPPPRTPASGKAHKGGSSVKSAKKHAFRTGQEEKENEGNSSEERGLENEIESSEVQRQETSAPIVEQKTRQESDNAATPPQPDEEQVSEEPVESPPISVEDPSSKDGAASDDDVVLIEKPIELIPVEDSDEEVEDIQLGVEKPSDERQDSHADDAQSNAVEKMPDKPAGEAPIDLDLVYANLTNQPQGQTVLRDVGTASANEGPRCNKCRHFGHTALKCTEKPEPPRCYLCGDGNHTEPRCPNKICLNMKEYFLTARAADLKTFVSSELKKLNTVKKSNLEHLKKEITLAMRQQRAMKLNRNPHSKKRTKEFHEKV